MTEEMKYPALVIDHAKFRENVRNVASLCEENGISVAGIIKVSNGMVSIADDYLAGGAKLIGSSRIEQLKRIKDSGITRPDGTRPELLLIRIPMMCEIEEVISDVDTSLNSELTTLKALNDEAIKQGKTHKVILMADLGDLREGWINHDELVDAAIKVENDMPGLVLAGIGTNLGCYGSVMPTKEKMDQLAELAYRVEEAVGHELEYVSGGASSSMMPLYDGVMNPKINMLRIGALCANGALDDLVINYGYAQPTEYNGDVYTLKAQVIEKKVKPTHPIGKLGVDAFGKKRIYEDKGDRLRVLLGIGRADYGDIDDLVPMLEGSYVVGASGDHTILDIEDCQNREEIAIGDVVTFDLKYSAILNLTTKDNVKVYDI